MDVRTNRTYERSADQWIDERRPRHIDSGVLVSFARRVVSGGVIADLGCGPGWYGDWLQRNGYRVVALDAAMAMLVQAGQRSPALPSVQADLEALPLRDQSLDGAWASSSYQHLPCQRLPLALARLHRAMKVGAPLHLSLARLDIVPTTPRQRAVGEMQQRYRDDSFKGRLFSHHSEQRARDLCEGAGFEDIEIDAVGDPFWMMIRARRACSLPDIVGPRLRLLVCGLNPSLYSADRGVAFARPGNRFWPAARAAGLVERERDPLHAFVRGIGMTDLVKRASARADELSVEEYAAGIARFKKLVHLHQPGATCFVGLDGWRKTMDKRAQPGWVEGGFAGRPAYLMPSTSGVNAHASLAALTDHLAIAAQGQ